MVKCKFGRRKTEDGGRVSREDVKKERLDLMSAFSTEFLDEGPGIDDLDTVEVLDLLEMMVS